MSPREMERARELLRDHGDLTPELLTELRRVTAGAISKLPASLSPVGHWDQDALDDVLQGWIEGKLLRGGGLLAILDRAASVGALARLAERSFYHWLLAQRERSQSRNIYHRLLGLLKEDFALVSQAGERQHSRYFLRDAAPAELFSGSERELASAAWGVGPLEVLRYSSEAQRLSPLISTQELKRFVERLMGVMETSFTPRQLMRALAFRLNLEAEHFDAFDEAFGLADPEQVAEAVVLKDAAQAVLQGLTLRQLLVLLGTLEEKTGAQMAQELDCSPGTIHADQVKAGQVVDRYAENDRERVMIIQLLDEIVGSEV